MNATLCYLPIAKQKKYWASGDHVPKLLANSIRRDRFLNILHNLHFQDNTITTNDRAVKLRPLMDDLQKKFKKHGGFPEYLAVDESMIPYFGKHYAKQFISGKPIRFGYKMWALCSKGGYLHAFDLYIGKTSNEAVDSIPNIGLGGNIIISLKTKAELPANNGHTVFFDNYFISITLMEEMKNHGYYASGICRDNRTDKCPISQKNFLKNEPRVAAQSRMSGDIMLMKWKDNKEVTLVSNFDSTEMKSTRRYDRQEKKYVNVHQPACFQLYNAHMGYVDIMNQSVSSCRIRMRQRKWWWPIFSYLLSVTVNNAYQLLKKKGTVMTQYEFIEALTIHYCKSFGQPSCQGQKVTSKLTDIARYDGMNHFIVSCEQARSCRQCKGRASFRCKKCEVGLHPKCFEVYHLNV